MPGGQTDGKCRSSDWVTEWWTKWLTDWLMDGWRTDGWTDWMYDWQTEQIDSPTDGWTNRQTDRWTDWPTNWLAISMNDWITWPIHWLTDWLTDWLNEWLNNLSWPTHWLTDWLTDSLIDRQMDGLTGFNIFHLKLIYIVITCTVSFILGWWEHCFGCGSHFHSLRVKIHGMPFVVLRPIKAWAKAQHLVDKFTNHVALMNLPLYFVAWGRQHKWDIKLWGFKDIIIYHHDIIQCRRFLFISSNEI